MRPGFLSFCYGVHLFPSCSGLSGEKLECEHVNLILWRLVNQLQRESLSGLKVFGVPVLSEC